MDKITFTADLAAAALIDGLPGPFGLTVVGEYRKAPREILRASVILPYCRMVGPDCCERVKAGIGDTIVCSDDGRFSVVSPDPTVNVAGGEPAGQTE